MSKYNTNSYCVILNLELDQPLPVLCCPKAGTYSGLENVDNLKVLNTGMVLKSSSWCRLFQMPVQLRIARVSTRSPRMCTKSRATVSTLLSQFGARSGLRIAEDCSLGTILCQSSRWGARPQHSRRRHVTNLLKMGVGRSRSPRCARWEPRGIWVDETRVPRAEG